MLVRNKKKFGQGLVLILSFAALFWVIMLPVFHDGANNRLTGLQYADTVFNELSKGSSYFIPEVFAAIEPMTGREVSLTARVVPALAPVALQELGRAGVRNIKETAGELSFSGDLGAILKTAVEDSESLYKDDSAALASRYNNANPLVVGEAWWRLLNPCVKELQKQGKIGEAAAVEEVVRRAIEPGYNFYGIPSARVSENIFLICAMMAFYVLYAVWYGFAVYRLFDGFGLLGPGQAKKNADKAGT